MYWITDSRQFNLMARVTESLAGRIGILRLQGLSQAEKDNIPDTMSFLPKKICQKRKTDKGIKGSYPALFKENDKNWMLFYDSYMQTYIERDVKQFGESPAIYFTISFALLSQFKKEVAPGGVLCLSSTYLSLENRSVSFRYPIYDKNDALHRFSGRRIAHAKAPNRRKKTLGQNGNRHFA